MSKVTVRLEVRTAWWWNWLYVPGVAVLAACGMVPDWDKVHLMAARATRVRAVRVTPAVKA